MKTIDRLYIFVLVFYVMWGAHAWFTWPLDDEGNKSVTLIITIIGSLISYLYAKANNLKFKYDTHIFIGICVFCIINAIYITPTLLGFGRMIIKFFPLFILIFDKEHAERNIISVSRILSVLLIISMAMHFYIMRYGRFPTIPIQYPGQELYLFQNYFVILKGVTYEGDGLRFHSVFLEPGYMGTMISFLLYAAKYDFKKWYNITLLIALLLSLSLAGYVVTFIGILLYRWSKGFSLIKVFPIAMGLMLSYIIVKSYNDGKNAINENILMRLEFDSEKGITGNNRVGQGTDFYYEQAVNDGSFIWGIGNEKISKINGGKGWEKEGKYEMQIRGAGYKIFILKFGIVAALIYLIFYYLMGPSVCKNTATQKYMLGFLLLIIITFIQASYPSSFSWLIPYLLASSSLDSQAKKIRMSNND